MSSAVGFRRGFRAANAVAGYGHCSIYGVLEQRCSQKHPLRFSVDREPEAQRERILTMNAQLKRARGKIVIAVAAQ